MRGGLRTATGEKRSAILAADPKPPHHCSSDDLASEGCPLDDVDRTCDLIERGENRNPDTCGNLLSCAAEDVQITPQQVCPPNEGQPERR